MTRGVPGHDSTCVGQFVDATTSIAHAAYLAGKRGTHGARRGVVDRGACAHDQSIYMQ